MPLDEVREYAKRIPIRENSCDSWLKTIVVTDVGNNKKASNGNLRWRLFVFFIVSSVSAITVGIGRGQ